MKSSSPGSLFFLIFVYFAQIIWGRQAVRTEPWPLV